MKVSGEIHREVCEELEMYKNDLNRLRGVVDEALFLLPDKDTKFTFNELDSIITDILYARDILMKEM